ncbi:MAG TPA: hypothetical protein VGL53_01715, partial [Bryobacteraceae bacterium]
MPPIGTSANATRTKFVLVAMLFLCGTLRAQALVTAGPALIIELRDDKFEYVTFKGLGPVPVPQELREAAFAAAGCESADETRGRVTVRGACRHPISRSSAVISSSWDFSVLGKALEKTGASRLTACIEHPDWPFAQNDRNLPLQK